MVAESSHASDRDPHSRFFLQAPVPQVGGKAVPIRLEELLLVAVLYRASDHVQVTRLFLAVQALRVEGFLLLVVPAISRSLLLHLSRHANGRAQRTIPFLQVLDRRVAVFRRLEAMPLMYFLPARHANVHAQETKLFQAGPRQAVAVWFVLRLALN